MAFDQFYTHIETVHDLISKTKESITADPVKIEIDEHQSKDDEHIFDGGGGADDDDDAWTFSNDLEPSDHDSIGTCHLLIS